METFSRRSLDRLLADLIFFPAPSSLDLTRNIVAVPSGFWEFITIVKARS